jgi:hypothetical protein
MKIRFPVPRELKDCELKVDEVSQLADLFRGMTPDEVQAVIARKMELHARAFAETLEDMRR